MLPLTDLGIRNAVHFVGHRKHRLRKEFQFLDMHRHLARVCDKKTALNADKIAVIDRIIAPRERMPVSRRGRVNFLTFAA